MSRPGSKRRASTRHPEAQRQPSSSTEPAGDRGSRDAEGIEGRVWAIACRLRGIGELIKFRGGEPPLDEDEVNYGIGEILTGLARELDDVRATLEK